MKKVIGQLARHEIEAQYTQDNDLSRSDAVYKCLVDVIRLMNEQKDVEKPHEDSDDDDDEDDRLEEEGRPELEEPTKGMHGRGAESEYKTKYGGQLYFTRTLFYCFQRVKEWIQNENLHSHSEISKMYFYCYDVLLRLSTEPFDDIIRDGDASNFYGCMPQFVDLYSYAGLPKVTRAAIFHLLNLQHMTCERSDVLKTLALNPKRVNDQFNELAAPRETSNLMSLYSK